MHEAFLVFAAALAAATLGLIACAPILEAFADWLLSWVPEKKAPTPEEAQAEIEKRQAFLDSQSEGGA